MATSLSFVLDHNVQRHELKLAESYAPVHGGLLPDDPFWHVLERRFEVALDGGHADRFRHYHPRIFLPLEGNLEAQHRSAVIPHSMPPMPYFLPQPVMPSMPPSMPAMPPAMPARPHVSVTCPAVSVPPPLPAAVPEPPSSILAGFGMCFVLLLGYLKWSTSVRA